MHVGIIEKSQYTQFNGLGSVSFFIEIKGIVNFEINFWYFLAYIKGIQDVGVFVSAVV